MNFKILQTNAECPDVLVYRDQSDEGDNIVVIQAYGEINGESGMIAYESTSFMNVESAKSFIEDYSVKSATEFCERSEIFYEK